MLPEEVVLASNTSSIPIAGRAASVDLAARPRARPALLLPVPVMNPVEVVVGLETSEETLALAEAFTAEIRPSFPDVDGERGAASAHGPVFAGGLHPLEAAPDSQHGSRLSQGSRTDTNHLVRYPRAQPHELLVEANESTVVVPAEQLDAKARG